jgi:tetratricopeptide (TPR) repeat protein
MVRLFMFRFLSAAVPAAAIMMLSAPSAPARADAILSDRLTDQILQLYRSDFTRRLESEFEREKESLGKMETVERATRLRMLLNRLASAYETLEEFDNAEADYNALVEVRPLNPMVYADRGYFYMRQSRFPEAARDFVTGSRLAPAEAVFDYGAGRAMSRMGSYADAVAQYGEAIRLTPKNSLLRLSRAEALIQLRRYAEARADYDSALALGLGLRSDRFSAYFGRGYANIFIGDYDGAVRDLNEAVAMHPGMVSAVVWRGYAWERLGQRARALDDYETASRLSPNDPWIHSSINRLRS